MLNSQVWLYRKENKYHEEDYIEWLKWKECADERAETTKTKTEKLQRN